MTEWTQLERDGTRLAVAGLGGSGPPVLLLHGLAGHAEEWQETANWLTETHAVFGLDLRGHGRSERRPDDVSMQAHAADAIAAMKHIGEPVILAGQSLGGLISIVVAATRPDLVRALVVIEASPAGLEVEDTEALASDVEKELRSWPLPFRTRDEAVAYFGGPSVSAAAWADGLEERDDGLWPRFDIDVMVRMVREAVGDSHWSAWDEIRCPVLIIRGETGSLSRSEAKEMVRRSASSRLIEVSGAGHDVHLDRPKEWREALSTFLDGVDRPTEV